MKKYEAIIRIGFKEPSGVSPEEEADEMVRDIRMRCGIEAWLDDVVEVSKHSTDEGSHEAI